MKNNIYLIIAGVFGFVILNIILFYAYPGKFSTMAYIIFLIVPLITALVIVFARFSFLFTSRISEQEDEKELLRERQEEIIENMVEGLVVHNVSGKIFSVNSTAERFLNISADKLLYRTYIQIQNKNLLLKALFEDKDLTNKTEREISFKDKYGKEYVFKIISVELNKKRGEILKIIRDISREKYLSKMKSEYITVMSHKFLTPLNGIKWTAPSLLQDNIEKSDKTRFINNIIKSADKLIELTTLLLRITEMEEGNFGYKFENTDLLEIVKRSIKDRKDDIKKKNIILSFESRESVLEITADKDRTKVVVDNFIDNAIKYTKEGGKIDVLLKRDGDNIKFSVKDNGIGISKESQQNIFTKFVRDDRAISMHTEGSGLGLFIAKNIIEEHGGKIGFTSSENNGSTFFFILPKDRKKKSS